MDGRAKLLLQLSSGVREIVEDIDSLRLKYGYESVEVLTPKVESRLRSGHQAAIPLKLRCAMFSAGTIVTITFPKGFPKLCPLEIDCVGTSETVAMNVANFCRHRDEANGHFMRSVEALEFLFESFHADNVKIFSKAPSGRDELLELSEGKEDVCDELRESDSKTPSWSHVTCMRCRYILFHNYDLNRDHDEGVRGNPPCTSLFVADAPTWLDTASGDEGKICCPKCGSKLGQWSWAASQCSCRAWLAPSFRFNKARVDLKFSSTDSQSNSVGEVAISDSVTAATRDISAFG